MISVAPVRAIALRSAITAALTALSVGAAAQERAWPVLPAPDHLDSFKVGSHMELDGLPVRIQGYVVDRSAAQLNQWYRERAGGRWVENMVGNKTVLGQRRGDHFITVELEPMLGNLSGSTTKVVTAIVDLGRPTIAPPASGRDAFGDWAGRLPATSQVLSHLTDSDATHDSLHLVAVNGQSVAFNAQHFLHEFRRMGWRHEAGAGAGVERTLWAEKSVAAQEKLAFAGPGAEAVVVLGRDPAGRSTVVLIINRSKR